MNSPEHQPSEIGLRIYPTHVVQYFVRSGHSHARSKDQLKMQLHLKQNKPAGKISAKASKRIKNAVNWLAASAQFKRVYCKKDNRTYAFKINFITLTLPSLDHGITDHQFKNRLLRVWLERMRYRHNLKNYVWKVETQANGNIHAHITTDCFIHYSEIREAWNSILIKNGLMRTFADKHGHSDPNSTDVKSVQKVKNLAAYLAKYFSKNDNERRKVSGRLWSSSYSLSDRNVCNIILPPSDDSNVLRPLVQSSAEHAVVESEPNSLGLRHRLATVYFMRKSTWRELQNSVLGDHYRRRINSIRSGKPDFSENSFKFKSNEHVIFNSKSATSRDIRIDHTGRNQDCSIENETKVIEIRKNSLRQLDLFQS